MKVFEDYKEKLVRVLPMNDVIFTTQLSTYKILPDSVDAHIKSRSLPTEPDKADYYLENVIKKSLDTDGTEEFEILITVMEKCGYRHVERLAKAMKSDLDKELKGEYIAFCESILINRILQLEVCKIATTNSKTISKIIVCLKLY